MAALRLLLAEMSEEDDAKVTTTELFARRVYRLANFYADDETEKFVRALGFLFAGIQYEGSPYGIILQRGPFRDDRLEHEPPTGLRTDLRDSADPESDQMHHYVAFLMYGFFLGKGLAQAANTIIETAGESAGSRKFSANLGDLRLGNLAAQHGDALRPAWFGWRQRSHRQLGDMVRADLMV